MFNHQLRELLATVITRETHKGTVNRVRIQTADAILALIADTVASIEAQYPISTFPEPTATSPFPAPDLYMAAGERHACYQLRQAFGLGGAEKLNGSPSRTARKGKTNEQQPPTGLNKEEPK